MTAAQGQNPARQAAINAGLPISIPAYLVNMLCGSGLKYVNSFSDLTIKIKVKKSKSFHNMHTYYSTKTEFFCDLNSILLFTGQSQMPMSPSSVEKVM